MSEFRKEVTILGRCPECNSLRIGEIQPGDDHVWLKKAKKYYDKHRNLLRYVPPKEWDDVCADRFCVDCGYEWREDRPNKYELIVFTSEESYEDFLRETAFDYEDVCFVKKEEKESRFGKFLDTYVRSSSLYQMMHSLSEFHKTFRR
jgi:phytoene dehydrogenase-like protein